MVPTLSVTPAVRRHRSGRLHFLDALRGVAVCLVLLQHLGELLFPAGGRLSAHGVQLGHMVFSLCSGLITPASLERGAPGTSRRAALGRFWRGRLFRLYPLYWLSLAGAAVLVLAGTYSAAALMTVGDCLANAPMLQVFAGSQHALPL